MYNRIILSNIFDYEHLSQLTSCILGIKQNFLCTFLQAAGEYCNLLALSLVQVVFFHSK